MSGDNQQHPLWCYQRQPVHLVCIFLCLLVFLSSYPPSSTEAATAGASPGTYWKTPIIIGNNESVVNDLLVTGRPGPSFAFGFIKRPSSGFLLAVFLVLTNDSGIVHTTPAEVVWTANRNDPIDDYAELNLTADGDLRLSDGSGNLVWSSNTSVRGVASLNLTVEGNLKLLDGRRQVIWQSFNHPTDTALPHQRLSGMKLVANASATNSSDGLFYLSVTNTSCEAYIVDESPREMYYSSGSNLKKFKDGVLLELPQFLTSPLGLADVIGTNNTGLPKASNWNRTGRGNRTEAIDPSGNRTEVIDHSLFAKGFVRLEADGHLREYAWRDDQSLWQLETSWFDDDIGFCGYPKVCGRYGICSDEDCSCPREDDETNTGYFEAVDERKQKQGCRLLRDLQPSCASDLAPDPRQKMALYKGIYYFGYLRQADMGSVSLESCKQACAMNCSCRAAFLKYGLNESDGDCYLISNVHSVIYADSKSRGYNSSAYFKVQLPDGAQKRRWKLALIFSVIGVLTLFAVCYGYVLYRRKSKLIGKSKANEQEDDDDQLFEFEQLPGMPTKFAYEELKQATDGFSTKLGEGGFGAVFKGTLRDGTQVAVKVLGYRGQGMKEFLAEVETIGSVHHLNLVRLVGYCAERLHRLLVYEYLSNGSLENWIFVDEAKSIPDHKPLLEWNTKMKIILHVAKGLSYLHEECRQRIIHLDIKPQNILLDDNFNAKVSDFGLSKLVERDQSQIITTMRGTPGYLAPEWLNSVITEKVDVYSFGVLVLETVSAKRILDSSRSQGNINLVNLLKKAYDEDRVADIINAGSNSEEAMRLVNIAMSCLQIDYTKRPTMPEVVKALDGGMEIEPATDFWIPATSALIIPPAYASSTNTSTPMLSVIPSGR